MTAAQLIAHCTAELDAIMAKSTSPTVDQKAAALKAVLAAEIPALSPTFTERRVGERRSVNRREDPAHGDRRTMRRQP